MSGAGPPHGFVDQALRNDDQLGVLALAEFPQPCERLLGAAAGATTQQSDGLVDDRPARQRGLQLECQVLGLREELGVVHCDGSGCGCGELFTKVGGVIIECRFAARIDVDGADDLTRQQQRQRQRTVHTEAANAGPESWPHLLPRPRPPEQTR